MAQIGKVNKVQGYLLADLRVAAGAFAESRAINSRDIHLAGWLGT